MQEFKSVLVREYLYRVTYEQYRIKLKNHTIRKIHMIFSRIK